MRRITRATWLVMAGALVASVLSAMALLRVSHQPRLATPFRFGGGPPLLSVVTPTGVVVVTSSGGYRVDGDGVITPLEWPLHQHVTRVRSAAFRDGTLALVASVDVEAAHQEQLLVLDGSRLTAVPVPGGPPLAVLGGDRLRVFFAVDERTVSGLELLRSDGGWKVDAPSAGSSKVLSDTVEGVLDVRGEPYLLIGERGAHWLVSLQHQLDPLPDGAFSVWSASVLRPPLNSPSRVPFLDAHGRTQAFTPAGAPALVVEPDGSLAALPVTRGVDEPGVFVTNFRTQRMEVKHTHRRVLASSDQVPAWRAVATSVLQEDFTALPLPSTQRWLLLDQSGRESVIIDGALRRLDDGDASATFAALTSQPRGVWLGLLAVLALLSAAAPLAVRRARRELRILDDADGLFLGSLKLPPGAIGQTDSRGRVPLAGDCQLRVGGQLFDLSSGARRFDGAASIPLVDGDRVFVVGRVETDQSGGPWRASHRQRLVPDSGRLLIGRGGAEEFARHLTAQANARLMAFALAHLTLALSVLGFLGLRPFI